MQDYIKKMEALADLIVTNFPEEVRERYRKHYLDGILAANAENIKLQREFTREMTQLHISLNPIGVEELLNLVTLQLATVMAITNATMLEVNKVCGGSYLVRGEMYKAIYKMIDTYQRHLVDVDTAIHKGDLS